MRKLSLLFFAVCLSLVGFTQNTFESNTSTSFTLNQPCMTFADGYYTVKLRYFDLSTGDYTTPTENDYISYLNVHITTVSGMVLFDFSGASPSANFPTFAGMELNQSSGIFKVYSGTTFQGQMNWDFNQLNCPALPVTLMNWAASSSQVSGLYQINLSWQTASESNSGYFLIERQVSNNLWKTIAQVTAAGNSSTTRSYSATDLYPVSSAVNLYRLKEVDLDGSCETFETRAVSMPTCGNCYRAQPSLPTCSYTISGQNVLCSGASTYSLSSIPNNGSITWSINSTTDAGLLVHNCTNSVTVTNKSGQGSVVVTAASGNCANAVTKTIQLSAGQLSGSILVNNSPSQPLYEETYGTNTLAPGTNMITLTNPTGSQNWELTASSSNSGASITYNYNSSNGYLYVTMPEGGAWAEFLVTVSTVCGAKQYYIDFYSPYSGYYSLSPNPVTSEVTVYVDDEKVKKMKMDKLSEPVIKDIMVLDKQGNVVLKSSYPSNTKSVLLNISKLRSDFYVVKIFNGQKWTSLKLMKK